jgi:hypothetical protein
MATAVWMMSRRMPLPDSALPPGFVRGLTRCSDSPPIFDAPPRRRFSTAVREAAKWQNPQLTGDLWWNETKKVRGALLPPSFSANIKSFAVFN